MALSRAEIQRRYREKKKKESGSFAKKERERKRKSYIPVAALDEGEAKKRRKETLKRVKRHYDRKKQQMQECLNKESPHTRSEKGQVQLTIKLDFKQKRGQKHGKKVICNEMEEAQKQIKELESLNLQLKREKKRIQKRLERARMTKSKTHVTRQKTCSPQNPENEMSTDESESVQGTSISSDESEVETNRTPRKETEFTNVADLRTPNSKANTEMRNLGLTPERHKTLKKRLVHFNVLTEEIKSTNAFRNCKLRIAKRYRCMRAFGKILGINRNQGKARVNKKTSSRCQILKSKVHEFLQREDNCVTMPGKRDQKQKLQKRILTDYLHNLYAKFKLENPDIKISRSTFSNLRPKHVLLVNFCSRNTCLCSRHQNIALKIKAIQDVAGTKNPDNLIQKNTDEEIQGKLDEIDKSHITFTEWKRLDESGKMRWKQVQTKVTKAQFIEMFTKDIKEFREHVNRVKNQYSQMRQLRENLEEGHVLLWMDFAENFTCAALDEVQSAYWTSEQVTLHTSVAYFPKSHDKTHKSVVGISDLNIHNSAMVISMVSTLVPIVQSEYPELKCVHYLTDSPTSQYRNKSIFEFLTRHESLFGVKGTWDYLESGHGKGPCDGLGGSVKRSADMAVKQGKVVIQNAQDFFSWATNQADDETLVKYYFVGKDQYETTFDDLKARNENIKAVKGTFKLHAVIPLGVTTIASRDLSCSCENCRSDVTRSTCSGWTIHDLSKINSKKGQNAKGDTEVQSEEVQAEETVEEIVSADAGVNNDETVNIEEGDFCATIYEKEWYIGKVIEKCESDDRYKIGIRSSSWKKWVRKKLVSGGQLR